MLRWKLEHGPHLEYSLAQLRNGENPPRVSYTQPRLRGDAAWIYRAFWELRGSGERATPPSEWREWCALQDIGDDELRRIGWTCLRTMESVWAEHKEAEREERRRTRGRGNVGEG